MQTVRGIRSAYVAHKRLADCSQRSIRSIEVAASAGAGPVAAAATALTRIFSRMRIFLWAHFTSIRTLFSIFAKMSWLVDLRN